MKTKLPLGYEVNGMACGIKRAGKPDLGLILSRRPAVAAGLFTTNAITSGSVKLCQKNLAKSRKFRAIIVNSGNANCWTKADSFKQASGVTAALADLLKIKKAEILFASTGIIGRALPVNLIKQAMPLLIKGLSESGLRGLARAILTTDTSIKLSSVRFNIGKNRVTIYGLAKGAGMISPNLATMLCFILSDANIAQAALKKALIEAAGSSFNCITVDGCMSTNDTLLMLANGRAGNALIKQESMNFNKFSSGLSQVCLNLAKMIVRDAEGASKFIQIKVSKARTYQQARQVALSIANSNLFKTAMYGSNRNLGRIIAALGSSGIKLRETEIKINASSVDKKDIYVLVQLNQGKAQASVYTSDLTPEYVKINASYS